MFFIHNASEGKLVRRTSLHLSDVAGYFKASDLTFKKGEKKIIILKYCNIYTYIHSVY